MKMEDIAKKKKKKGERIATDMQNFLCIKLR